MENYIKKYFDQLESNINKHLNNPEFSSEDKEKLSIRLELINELKPNISWQFKTQEEKQISRIQKLASMRRAEALPHLIKKQEQAICIYDTIKTDLLYIEALSTSVLNTLKLFCENLLDMIDLRGYNFDKDFPTNKEIGEAFKLYFEITKPAKGNGNMFEECYEKIETLYNELMKLNEIPSAGPSIQGG